MTCPTQNREYSHVILRFAQDDMARWQARRIRANEIGGARDESAPTWGWL